MSTEEEYEHEVLEEQFVPLNDASSSHPHDNNTGDASSVGSAWAPLDSSTPESPSLEGVIVEPAIEREQSIQDRLVGAAAGAGTSALLGSLELLKIAGGFTLSTTGKLVAPPLKVTQQIILPSLWAATMDYLRKATPKRIRDWFRILSASLYHLFAVLRNTHRGQEFRSRVGMVGADLVDCLSSDASRQVIIDSMAAVVKLSESMHTPEFKSFLDQMNILGARLVDVAASGRNKQLMNDFKETLWSGVELMSDPSTILALAEVTATLCHTLEMEDALYRRMKEKPQRRFERNQFTTQAYTEPDLMRHTDVTVEQVIMSGLGGDYTQPPRGGGPPLGSVAFENPVDMAATSASDGSIPPEDQWTKAGRDKVDSPYLEQKIRSRSQQMEQQRMLRTTITTRPPEATIVGQSSKQDNSEGLRDEIEDLVLVETVVEEEGDSNDTHEAALQRQNTPKANNTIETSKQSVTYVDHKDFRPECVGREDSTAAMHPAESDSAVSHFYRTLDDLLAEKRAQTFDELVERDEMDVINCLASRADKCAKGRDALNPTVTAMDALDSIKAVLNGKDKGSLKQVFAALRRSAKDGDSNAAHAIFGRAKTKKKTSTLPAFLVASLLSFALLWFGFGCYGIYAFVESRFVGRVATVASTSTKSGTQDIVIRIVKEVVHVNQQGDRIDNGYLPVDELPLNVESVANCVSNLLGQE